MKVKPMERAVESDLRISFDSGVHCFRLFRAHESTVMEVVVKAMNYYYLEEEGQDHPKRNGGGNQNPQGPLQIASSGLISARSHSLAPSFCGLENHHRFQYTLPVPDRFNREGRFPKRRKDFRITASRSYSEYSYGISQQTFRHAIIQRRH